MAQKIKVVATETCHSTRRRGKKGESKRAQRSGGWGLEENSGKRESQRLSPIRPGLEGVDGKLEGKVYSADSLVGQHSGGQAAMPINAAHPSQV